MEYSLQLYTVRTEAQKDFEGTLEKVAQAGYKGVEFAGYFGIPADRMLGLLQKNGLGATSSHVPYSALTGNLDHEINYSLDIGNNCIVCPHASLVTREDYDTKAGVFDMIGEACRKKGLQFCYHNHNFEFTRFDGRYGLDILYDLTDPELVKAELDTYWIRYAGEDPLEYIRKYADRCELVHLKDMLVNDAGEMRFAEVGEGVMDTEGLIRTSLEYGISSFIVEQDICERPELESIKLSITNLKKIKI